MAVADYDYIVPGPQTVQLSQEDRDLFHAILDAVRNLGGEKETDNDAE